MLTVLGQLTDRPAVSFVRRHAMVAALLAIAALTLLTALGTGDQSPLWGLIAVPLVMSALVLPPRPLAVVAGVTAAGMLAPFAEELNAAQYAGVGATLVVAALLGYTTERARRANQQLAAEADRLRTIADSVHEGLYWMRHVPDSRYVYVNHAMAELSGFPEQAWLDDPDLAFRQVHPDDMHVTARTREDPTQLEWPVEVRWKHPDQGWVWFSLRETPLYRDGQLVGVVGVVVDLTREKEEEARLQRALAMEREANEQLRRLEQSRNNFLRSASHRLRTPLTAILGFVRTLEQHYEAIPPEQARDMLRRAARQSEELQGLVVDLLDIDGMQQHETDLMVEQFDLAASVIAVAEAFGDAGRVRCSAEPAQMVGDARLVERMLARLIDNALIHTSGEVRVELAGSDGHAFLTVEDDGPGIDKDDRERVWEAFEQGSAVATMADPGTGLGLAYVRAAAQLHGGRSWVEPTAEGGARFCVELPLRPPVDPTIHGEPRPMAT